MAGSWFAAGYDSQAPSSRNTPEGWLVGYTASKCHAIDAAFEEKSVTIIRRCLSLAALAYAIKMRRRNESINTACRHLMVAHCYARHY